MKVAFIADDGTIFSEAAECVKYETKCAAATDIMVPAEKYVPLAWGRSGRPLGEDDDYDNAMFVYLDHVDAFNNALRFMDWVIDTGGDHTCYEGIDEECEGLFYWDEWNCSYVWADFDIIDTLVELRDEINKKS